MTTELQNKIEQLTALRSSNKDRKKLAKQLQIDISALIDKQPDLPHKGELVWTWSGETIFYGSALLCGTVKDVVWKPDKNCFKVGIDLPDKWKPVWRPLDRVWRTQLDAEHWDLLRRIKDAEQNLKAARRKLYKLKQQLKEYS